MTRFFPRSGNRLDVVFPFETPDTGAAAEWVVSVMRSARCTLAPARLYDRTVAAHEIGGLVSDSRRPTFEVSFPDSAASLSRIKNFQHSCLMVDIDTPLQPDWEAMVAALFRLWPFVSVRLVDREYDYWQNAFDPLQFQAAGRPLGRARLKSNGLPPPLEQTIIDTSENPGRRTLRNGYVEAIGSRMWLGPEFFVRVPGENRAAIVTADWLNARVSAGGMVDVSAAKEPFSDESTAALQNRMRRALFPTTA